MSHSTRAQTNEDAFAKYRLGWQATSKLLRAGKSFSGHERNCAYLNCPSKNDATNPLAKFANVSAVSGLDFPDDGRAVCVTDWDHDGDLDLWFHNRTGPRLRFMRNGLRDSEHGVEPQTHYVAFRLQGTNSNRDGIGARVSIWQSDDAQPQMQTVYAGDAFMSQSSKWLHFGLGDNSHIERVTVRWPNGVRQEFAGIQADRRHMLIEGNDSPDVLPLEDRHLAINDSEQPTFEGESTMRTVLPIRLPLPDLPYKTLDGGERTIVTKGVANGSSSANATLVVLWASWCPACQQELSRLAEHSQILRDAGVEVVLLALDGLDGESSFDASKIRQTVKQLRLPFDNVPFDIGQATPELLDKLTLSESIVLNRAPSLAVPLNLLVDKRGSLAAIYYGIIDIETVVIDVGQMDMPLTTLRDRSVPFPGRWTTDPRQMSLVAVGNLFKDHGYDDDYVAYLELDKQLLDQRRQSATSEEQRDQLDRMVAAENYNLGIAMLAQNRVAEGREYFQRAIEVNPQHVNALVNLAVIDAQQSKMPQAIEFLQRAIKIDPDSVAARTNLGNAMSAAGKFGEAIEHYSHLVRAGTASAAIHSRLARALIETDRFDEAVKQLDVAVELGAEDAATLISLAWIRATSPNESLRDGDRALELAERLISNRVGSQAMAWDVRAAARAEQGDFQEAIVWANKSIQMLDERQSVLRKIIESRIRRYGESIPHRDADHRYP